MSFNIHLGLVNVSCLHALKFNAGDSIATVSGHKSPGIIFSGKTYLLLSVECCFSKTTYGAAVCLVPACSVDC